MKSNNIKLVTAATVRPKVTKPRLRSITDAMKEIKQNDPDTALTEYTLRRLVKSGRIPSVYTGGRYLVNMDVVERHLQGQ